ncbi:hypothetical protein AYO22_02774 [Fonsecaea multimorphosa]|nr:hypothetical protein AYO22_02774 [Fonsecaea multimorphosa]
MKYLDASTFEPVHLSESIKQDQMTPFRSPNLEMAYDAEEIKTLDGAKMITSAYSWSFVSNLLIFLRQHMMTLSILLILLRFFYRRYLHPLSSYPGPFLASITRLWKVWSVYSGHTERDYIAVHKKYGKVVRVGPNELSFAAPAAAYDIFTPGNGFTKTDFYAVFPLRDIFGEVREWKHAHMKRMAVVPYSLASVQKMGPYIEDVQKELIRKVGEYAKAAKPCDLGELLHYFAFDRYGFLAQEKDVGGTIKFIDDSQRYNGLVGQMPEMRHLLRENPVLQLLMQLLRPRKVAQMALKEIERRKESSGGFYVSSSKKDLLGQLLEASAKYPGKLSDWDVFSVAQGAIGAGADSTASTMQSFVYYILSSPDVYTKLTKEIRSAGLSEYVSWAEAQELLYFQACLSETMRLRPAVGLSIPRYVPRGGARIDDKYYPGGTIASVNGWVVHRDPTVYGDHPDEFRPERWLTGNVKEMKRHMYQFGGGGHLCIGRNLALFEMNKILPQLLANFDLELVYPGKPLQSHSYFFVVQSGLEVMVKRSET